MTTDPFLNRQLDEYLIEAPLGSGGMARVYRGLDVRLKRRVAIKVIDAQFRSDSEYMRRFEREAQAIAQLEHPHIVRLYRYGEVEGVLYMAMQFVEGTDLQALLSGFRADGEWMALEDVARLADEIAQALDYAHSQGVIHRDVKPANILLDKQGRVYLTDFGLALLTEVGTRGEIFGTPHYIAPEQAISSAGAVPQSDLYSLGIMLYEMVTGEVPFNAQEPLDVAMMHMSEAPRPLRDLRPDLNPRVEAVILKMLAKEPRERYASGAACVAELRAALRAQKSAPAAQTIMHRVTLAAPPALPPLPAAVTPPPPAQSSPPLPVSPTPAAPQPTPFTGGRSLLLMGSLIAVALVILGWLGRGFVNSESFIAPTPTLPNLTPLADATACQLCVVKVGKDGLFLVNASNDVFDLTQFKLEGNGETFEGQDWERVTLRSQECIAIWKEGKISKLPKDVNCLAVAKRISLSKPDKFWSPELRGYYEGQEVMVCPEKAELCAVQWPTQ